MTSDLVPKNRSIRLEHYLALGAAFLTTGEMADAAIVHTDFDPDEVAQNSNVEVDLDGDGVWDLRIEQAGYSASGPSYIFYNHIARLRGNTASGPAYGWVNNGAFNLAAAVYTGATIGPGMPITTSTWATVGANRLFSSSFFSSGSIRGDWPGVSDKFLGVQFAGPGGIHYGWIRISVTFRCDQVFVHDYAYEDTPGVPIVAGDTGPAACSSATPPQNPSSFNDATKAVLSWDVVSGSVACQIQGNRLVPAGPSPSVVTMGSEPTSFDVPYAAAGAGTTWSWQVRCACSTAPLDATAFSTTDTFNVPILREGEAQVTELYPNPTTDHAQLSVTEPVQRDTEVRIMDVVGREVDLLMLPTDARRLELDLSALEPGMYFIRVGELDAVPIEVTR